MGGDGRGSRGQRIDAAAAVGGVGGRRGRMAEAAAAAVAGEGVGERRRRRWRRGRYLKMSFCVELFFLFSWQEGHLVIGEVTPSSTFPPQSSRWW